MKDLYRNFSELARHRQEGRDFRVIVKDVPKSAVAIVAPHGGNIEWNTAEMAAAIAGTEHSLYVFKGEGKGGGFRNLHLTSIHFDEPRALALVGKAKTAITVHGCRFEEPVVYLSGTDTALEQKLCAAFNAAGIKASIEGHPYQTGTNPANICNRNRTGKGVQIEFSRGIRDSAQLRQTCVKVVRETLGFDRR